MVSGLWYFHLSSLTATQDFEAARPGPVRKDIERMFDALSNCFMTLISLGSCFVIV